MGVGLAGALVKFGDAKATVTESSIDVDDNSYNGVNYGMMIAGGIMFVTGIMIASHHGTDAESRGAYLQIDHGFQTIALGYDIRY
jgi:hypothetical protein